MKLSEVRNNVYDLVAAFFQGATVIWVEQIATKPNLPYVTIKVHSPSRDAAFTYDDIGAGYGVTAQLELNVYTKGKEVTYDGNATINYENTAEEDLLDFFDYLDSDNGLMAQTEAGISINMTPPIRDLSSLENNASYRYRAMAEATIGYRQDADGAYGIGVYEVQDIEVSDDEEVTALSDEPVTAQTASYPTPSGGGTSEMAETDTERITETEITEI